MYRLVILLVAISTAADGRKGERLLIQSRASYDKAMNEIRSIHRLVKSFELAILTYSGFEELVGYCCNKSESTLAPYITYYPAGTYDLNSTTVEPIDYTETIDMQEVTTVADSADDQSEKTSEDLINSTTENPSPSEDPVDNSTENPPKIPTEEDIEPNDDQENSSDDFLNKTTTSVTTDVITEKPRTKPSVKPWIKTRKGKKHHTKEPHETSSAEDNFSVTLTLNPMLIEDLVKSTTEKYTDPLSEDPVDNRTEYSPETQTDGGTKPNGDKVDPLQDDPLNETTLDENTYTTSATTDIMTRKTKKPRTKPSLKPWTKTGKGNKTRPSKDPMDNTKENLTDATTEDSGDKTTWNLPETPIDKDIEPNEQQQNFTDNSSAQTTGNEDTYTTSVTTGIITKRKTKKRTKPSFKPWTKQAKEKKHKSKRPHTILPEEDYFSVTTTEDPMDTSIDSPWNKPSDDPENIINDSPGLTTRRPHTRKTKPSKHRTKHRHTQHKKDKKHKTKKHRTKHRHTQHKKNKKHKSDKTKKHRTKRPRKVHRDDETRYDSIETKKRQMQPSRTTLRLDEKIYYDDSDDSIELNVVIDI